MNRRACHISVGVLACVGAGLGVGRPALAQGDWELMDRDLHRQRVELTQMRDGAAFFVDADGRTRSAPTSSLLALIHEQPPEERPARDLLWIRQQAELFGPLPGGQQDAPAPFGPWLELTDGQRWSGSLVSGRGDMIIWSLRGVVDLSLPLDRVRAMVLRPSAMQTPPGVEDRVVLVNGDVLDGFVASVGEPTRIESAAGDVEVPMDRLASMVLANPNAPPTGVFVWTDADILSARSVEVLVTGRVLLQMGSESPDAAVEFPASGLRAVLLDASAISPLVSMPMADVEHPAGLLWAGPPLLGEGGPLGAGAIELRGPVLVRWRFPRGAARFAATALLPPAMWAWGDCEIVVRAGGAELYRERLNAERPQVEVNVPLGGSTELVVEIESGASGPVQDHVRLESPIISWR